MAESSKHLNDLAVEILSCPVCSQSCTPPITQCANGHNVCAKCRPLISRCALCKEAMTSVRNLFAETMCQTIKFPCKYRASGCTLKIQRSQWNEHLKQCPFAKRCQLKTCCLTKENCFVPCDWSGRDNELEDHVKAVHPSHFSYNATATHEFPIRRRVDARLIQTTNLLFWSIMSFDFKSFTMRAMVFSFGTQDEASRYGFTFEVLSESGYALAHRGTVVSTQGLHPDLRKFFEKDYTLPGSEDGTLVFRGKATLKRFVNENIFNCRVTISPKDDELVASLQ